MCKNRAMGVCAGCVNLFVTTKWNHINHKNKTGRAGDGMVQAETEGTVKAPTNAVAGDVSWMRRLSSAASDAGWECTTSPAASEDAYFMLRMSRVHGRTVIVLVAEVGACAPFAFSAFAIDGPHGIAWCLCPSVNFDSEDGMVSAASEWISMSPDVMLSVKALGEL